MRAETHAGASPRFGHPMPPRSDWLRSVPAESILDQDLPIIDTHHHLWDRPGNRYFLEELGEDLTSGHNVIATVFCESQAMYDAAAPTAMRPVGETTFVAALGAKADAGNLARHHVAAGIVAFADLTLGEAVEPVLHGHLAAGAGRMRGVRYATGWDASDEIRNSPAASAPHVLARTDVRAGLGVLASLGLSFDAMVFHPQLDDVIALARALPGLTIIAGHAGAPLGYGPYHGKLAEVFRSWKTSMTTLAELPNVTVKLGGVLSRLAAIDYLQRPLPPTSAELAETWRPWMETCIELFGAERCMFESNFPVEKMGASYATLWNAFKRIAQGSSGSERQSLFHGTARRVYRLDV